jgi:hypothetical protein
MLKLNDVYDLNESTATPALAGAMRWPAAEARIGENVSRAEGSAFSAERVPGYLALAWVRGAGTERPRLQTSN